MKTQNYILRLIIICLLFAFNKTLDICNRNKCKNGSVCLPIDNDEYKCQCSRGFKGKHCDEKINFCHPNPCQNGATCSDLEFDYRCNCLNGWNGQNCQINVDDCALMPCKNGGICKDLVNHKYICECPSNYIGLQCEHSNPCAEANPCGINGKCISDNTGSYKCHCQKGFMGPACSIDIDECVQYETELCENGGKCINTIGSYRCECARGYSGERCSNDIVDCKSETCLNGGTCLDKIGRYRCICTDRYRGDNCEISIPICETVPCKNNGQCRDNGNGFYCICPKQWTGDTCETRLDPCATNPCLNNGKCEQEGENKFKCNCKSGFTGKACEYNIDDCSGIRCQNKGSCEDLVDSWRCKCIAGYTGRYCEIDINDCQTRPCRNNGHCLDLVNDYKCICLSGWAGKNCDVNIDECSSRPCANGGLCKDRVGGFTCHCQNGFVGARCEFKSDLCSQLMPCTDGRICRNDPSLLDGYRCLCPPGQEYHDCTVEAEKCQKLTCTNGQCSIIEGEERCICTPGFIGSRCETENDECFTNLCQNNGTCQDMFNDFFCHCAPGFKGKRCEININDCINNPCGGNGICIDEISGFRCKCFLPYFGPTCSSIYDPCNAHLCENDAMCIPTNDYKSYACNCSSAVGTFEGRHCELDINECLLDETKLISHKLKVPITNSTIGPCFSNASCINTNGSFICKCNSGFVGQQCDQNTDDCANDPCKHGGRCEDLINDYKCHCLPGFVGDKCEIDIDECENNPCQNKAQCYDHVNNYQCLCKTGFSGENCEINDNDCTEQSCLGHGTCVDKINDYQCYCFNGYKGRNCELREQPCDKHNCLNNATCTNRYTKANEPGYICNCIYGFSGSFCEIKMDWCRGSPCGEHGTCRTDGEVFKCKCSDGYVGERCEIETSQTCESFSAQRQFNKLTISNKICLNEGFCFNQPEIGGFQCSCRKGFRGTFCEENIDDCANQPCKNDGVCTDGAGMYSCKCASGFEGLNCQENINDCLSDPCIHGRCIDQINNFTCICPRGTSSRTCDVVEDNCKYVKCLNGGTCQNNIGDFTCKCESGFDGKYCQINVNECRYVVNGSSLIEINKPFGSCSPIGTSSCVDGRGDFTCQCKPMFAGRFCQTRIDRCEEMKKIGKEPCSNGGICVNHYDKHESDKHSYRCKCPTGFGGTYCQLYSERCQYSLCQNGGVCRPVNRGSKMSFECHCLSGVGGRFCEIDFVNECDVTNCYNGGVCLDGYGNASCQCSDGFCGNRCEISDVSKCRASSVRHRISYMEELTQCHAHNCSSKNNNSKCDLECNHFACGFDGNECLHKVPKVVHGNSMTLSAPWTNCSIILTQNIPCHHWFMNGRCDEICNTEQCIFDGWDCEKVINQCPNREYCDLTYGDKHCNRRCNSIECDYDGGDCLDSGGSIIPGSIVLVLPVTTTVFIRVWQKILIRSLINLLHSIVRIKRKEGGALMIYPIKVFIQSENIDFISRHKRSAVSKTSNGILGTEVYLEIDSSICKTTKNRCFDNSKSAAEFVTAALHSRSYTPPIQILSVLADGYGQQTVIPLKKPISRGVIYALVVIVCFLLLGTLIGVLYGVLQNKAKSNQIKRARIWFPDGMKQITKTKIDYNNIRLGSSIKKKKQLFLNRHNSLNEIDNIRRTMKPKDGAMDSIEGSGSNSLTSTRLTSFESNGNGNCNEMANALESCMLLSGCDTNCNFPMENEMNAHTVSNDRLNEWTEIENCCFNALVNLIIADNGLGELTSSDSNSREVVIEKLFQIVRMKQTNADDTNALQDANFKEELTNCSLRKIINLTVPQTGETLLHIAARYNRKEAVRFLIEAGSDPNQLDHNRQSCLHTAIDAGAFETATHLIEYTQLNINIHQKGPGGATPLMQAIKGAHLDIIHKILQHTQPDECDLNITDDLGRTALHWASATNQTRIVLLLLSYGLNRDAADTEEMTPLLLACKEGSLKLCKILLANGANPDMRNYLDQTPLDVARANQFDELVSFLEEYSNMAKENQQNLPLMFNQYDNYRSNYYYPSQTIDRNSVFYKSPNTLGQFSKDFYLHGTQNDYVRSKSYNQSLAALINNNNSYCCAYPSNCQAPTNNTQPSRAIPNVAHNKHMTLGPFYKNDFKYLNAHAAPNVHTTSNQANFVCRNNLHGYPANNHYTSSTSIQGISPSPDSDSIGHWSTSSPSLSPRSRSKNLATHFNPQQNRIGHQPKSTVLHYYPKNGIYTTTAAKTTDQCGLHLPNGSSRY